MLTVRIWLVVLEHGVGNVRDTYWLRLQWLMDGVDHPEIKVAPGRSGVLVLAFCIPDKPFNL